MVRIIQGFFVIIIGGLIETVEPLAGNKKTKHVLICFTFTRLRFVNRDLFSCYVFFFSPFNKNMRVSQ